MTLPRPRIADRLDGILSHRLTVIVAGTGAGKTTAVSHWSQDRPVAWLTLTAADSSLGSIARRTVEALRLRMPGMARELLGVLDSFLGGDRHRAETVAARLCDDIGRLLRGRHIVLVFDDLQLLPTRCAGAALIEGVCRNAPEGLHVVLVSRERVPFSLARFALDSDLLELGAADLAFDADETAALLSAIVGTADRAVVSALQQRSGGWAAITRLAAEAIRRTPGQAVHEMFPSPTHDRLFEYLADEVLGTEGAPVRVLLRASAELPWVAPEMLARFDHGFDSTTLERALRRGLYFVPSERSPAGMTLIPVMRRYLVTLPMDPATQREVLRGAGDWYQGQGAHLEALECFERLGDHERLAALLTAHGIDLLESGAASVIIAASRSLPDGFRSPDIVMVEGEALQAAGDWESALGCYRTLEPPEGPIPPGLAWRIGVLHYLRGDLPRAIEAYERAGIESGEPADRAMLLAWKAAAVWARGDSSGARDLATSALDTARPIADSRALAAAHTVLAMVAASDGDRLGNDAHYLRALEHAERAHDIVQTIRIRVNRGSRNLEEGSYAAALEELDIALRLSDVAGLAAFRAAALSNRGQVLLNLGRLEEAVADLEESRSVYRSIHSARESYPLAHLGDVYRIRGDVALARAAYEQAIELADRTDDMQGLVPALSGLARLLAADEPEVAAAAADRAARNDGAIDRVAALVASGWVVLQTDRAAAEVLAERAAVIARTRRDPAGHAEALELRAAVAGVRDPAHARELLLQARRIWESLDSPIRVAMVDVALARQGGGDAAPVAASAVETLRTHGAFGPARDAERLLASLVEAPDRSPKIRTLGGFAVVRDGEPVPVAEWQSKKARDVLKMLVVARGRPIHREILMDRLWPGEHPRTASNRLSVALSTVRSILDPDHLAPADRFVGTDRDSVWLVLDDLAVDIESFLSGARSGLAEWRSGERELSSARLEAAEALYVGDMLEDDPYEEWAIPLREECRTVYLQIAAILAVEAERRGDLDGAVRLYLRTLERDPYNEPAHLNLVGVVGRLGRHGDARRLYGIYVARMQELGVDPAPFPGRRGGVPGPQGG